MIGSCQSHSSHATSCVDLEPRPLRSTGGHPLGHPASSLLRASPPPRTAEPARHRVLVESHTPSPPRLPVFPVDSSFTHAIATTPAGPVESCRSFLSTDGGLPCRSGKSAPALGVSRSARRSLTLWPACLLTPQGSLFQECFSPIRFLLEPPQVLPVGATS